jgi:hypothetical protein
VCLPADEELQHDLVGDIHPAGYKHISIVGYSIGSVVALDTLFPPTTTQRTVPAHIDALVTIGCPHDAICCFYRDYFARRSARDDVPKVWVNVFNPVDALSSNFRPDSAIYCDGRPAEADESMNIAVTHKPENRVWNPLGRDKGPTRTQVITWMGLRSHSMYWNRTFDGDHGCIADILDVLLQ